MLADAEDVEPDLIGELDLFDQVLDPLDRCERLADGGFWRDVGEGMGPSSIAKT